MRFRGVAVLWSVMAVVLGCAAVAQSPQQQQPSQGGCYLPDASGKQVFVPNCGLDQAPTRKAAPAPANGADPAKSFPFPGETNAAAPQQGAASSAPNAPNAAQPSGAQTPSAPAGGSSPAAAFPFPGEDKTPLVNADGSVSPAGPQPSSANGGGLKDAGSSGESSSSDDSSSSSSSSSSSGSAFGGLPDDPDTKGPLADDDTVLKKPHKRERKAAEQTPSEREAEDLSVFGFYMGDQNYRGAYLRAADAVAVEGDDPDAHLALADAARKVGKMDQALAEYKKTLTMDPVPQTKKAATKALKELAGGN